MVIRSIFGRIDQLNLQNETTTAVEHAALLERDFDLLQQGLEEMLDPDADGALASHQLYETNETVLPALFRVVEPDTLGGGGSAHHALMPLRRLPSGHEAKEVYIDLLLLNRYLQNANPFARAYASVYTAEGYCLVHPDSSKVATLKKDGAVWLKDMHGSIQYSDYLNLPVRRFVYPLKHLFAEAYTVISVPIIEQEKEIMDILFFSIILGAALLFILVVFSIILYYQWKKEHRLALDRANLQKEQALVHFERLREQMNPHFLFNTLGSLQQLVKRDQERAQSFIGKMAKIYRTLLRRDHTVSATVEEELSLATAYLFLQEIRFKNAIAPIDIQVEDDALRRFLPRWSLQIVIENAIKHNEFTPDKPLSIQIAVEGDLLIVRNNYRPKQNPEKEAGGYGLDYIRTVYKNAGQQGFSSGVEKQFFIVYLPFL